MRRPPSGQRARLARIAHTDNETACANAELRILTNAVTSLGRGQRLEMDEHQRSGVGARESGPFRKSKSSGSG